MLAIRLHQLGQGGSVASPTILEALLSMLTLDALPAVLEYGSIGTGDLFGPRHHRAGPSRGVGNSGAAGPGDRFWHARRARVHQQQCGYAG
jgi:histidine ammonia-lyase